MKAVGFVLDLGKSGAPKEGLKGKGEMGGQAWIVLELDKLFRSS